MNNPRSTHFPLFAMHLSFFFSGAATLLLEATLPVFAIRWHLQDSQSGLLLAAQFCGLFTGAISLSRNLRLTLLSGYLVAAIGFSGVLLASTHPHGFHVAIAAFFLVGLGVGQVTTTVNLLSALRYADPRHRSSALSLLNFTWSAGAMFSPLLAGFYLNHASLAALLLTFIFAAVVLFAALRFVVPPVSRTATVPEPSSSGGIPIQTLVYFCALFLLYGGLEATLGGWLSTYTLRYTSLGIGAAAYCTTAMWAAFACGRAIAGLILRRVPERAVRNAGILITMAATLSLRVAHSGFGIAGCAAFIGLGIAPFFPITFSLLIARGPAPRQAGICSANIGLGSALFPYLTGLLSNHLASLQGAMLAPVAIGLFILALCQFDWLTRPSQRFNASP